MRWLLYGDLGERHVVESFETALREAGHDVARLPSLVAASGPLDADADRERERKRALDAALPADVVFVFRVDELTPALVRHLRGRGARTIGWLCDDPLYYEQTYRHIVDAYEITLHTAHDDLLRFYAERHGTRGYAFPYWTDDAHYPYVYDLDAADVEVGFVGSFGGKARRRWRYDLLASLPFDVRFYGPVAKGLEDDAAMSLGLLDHDEIPRALRRFRVAINLAQSFDEPVADRWSSPELARFREYFFPSRLIAYAAAGVPAVSLHRPGAAVPLASTRAATSRAGLVAAIRELLTDGDRLRAASRAARDEFEACLTARSRVRMLEAILAGTKERSLAEQALLWRMFGDRPAPPRPGALPIEVVEPSPVPEVVALPRGKTRSLLLIGRGGRIERQIARGARLCGHDVALFDVAWLVPGTAGAPRGYGPLEIDVTTMGRVLRGTGGTDLTVFVDGCAPSADAADALRRDGVTRACLRLADPAFALDAITYLDRFDAVVTTSPEAAANYREKGAARVLVVDASAEPMDDDGGSPTILGGDTAEGLAIRTRLESIAPAGEGAGLAVVLPDTPGAVAEALTLVAAGLVPVSFRDHDAGLEPDREGLAYRDVAELVGIVGYYGRRPEELQPIAGAGRARVVAGRRWADRWPQILDAMPLPPRREGPRVVVAGYYGMDNLGDDLILDVIGEQLGGRVQVLGYDPAAVAARTARAGAHLLEPDSEDVIANADLLVIGSGGLVHDRELAAGASLEDVFDDPAKAGIAGVMARSAAVAATRGTPVALLALGAGPVSSDAGRTLVRFLVQRSSATSVRDRASLDVLRASGVSREVTLAADPTLLLPRPEPAAARAWLAARGVETYVTVAMRRWPDAPPDLPERLAAVLDAIAMRIDGHVVFVPFQRHPQGRRDEEANRAVAERMNHRDRAVHLDEADPAVTLGILAGARLGIGMRLHASILANAFGVPTLGLGYDPKVAAFYAESDRAGFALRLDAPVQKIVSLALEVLDRREEYAAALEDAIAPLRERARLAFDAVRPLVRVDPDRRGRTRQERDAGLAALRRELTR